MRPFDELDETRLRIALRLYEATGWSVSDERGRALCGYVPNEAAAPVRFVLKDNYFNPYERTGTNKV